MSRMNRDTLNSDNKKRYIPGTLENENVAQRVNANLQPSRRNRVIFSCHDIARFFVVCALVGWLTMILTCK